MESGAVTVLEPGLRRLLAPNPSPMTLTGTNTYLIGAGDVVVIDPGPAIMAHLDAILGALAPGERIARILVTHSHLDHSPLARPLSEATGAPVLAAGPSDWGRSAIMADLAAKGEIGGGEGVDHDFAPDENIREGAVLAGAWGEVTVLETPGHMANHLSFVWGDRVFSGDLVMGWSTSLVSPPDGDMAAFMASVQRLAYRSDRVFHPGHGDPVPTPQARCRALLDHRRAREAQIIAHLQDNGEGTALGLAQVIYTDLPPALLPAAERNVMAHLIDLHGQNRVSCEGPIGLSKPFNLS